MSKKVLIVVDMQNDFIKGSLGFEKAKPLVGTIEQKLKKFDGDVIFTLDTHKPNYLDTFEGQNLPVEHCIEGTSGYLLPQELVPYTKGALIFKKNTFGSLDLANYLKVKKYEEVHIVGLVSNICVLSQAVLARAALSEAKIFVDKACTSCAFDDINEATFKILEGLFIDTKHYD